MRNMRANASVAEQAIVPPEGYELPDRDTVFPAPRSGDWILLLIMIATLLGCGAYVWYRLGFSDHIGRAVFFGLTLLCLFWVALIYVFKLSLSIRVGPQGLSIVRGPWRMEMRWGEVGRLMERVQAVDNRRYRWVVAQARDDRRIQVREDAVADYQRFRVTVYEYYRAWRDHGGTWGTASGGPFVARELVGDEIRWWLIGMAVSATPGLYFLLQLPETNPLGYVLLGIAALCLLMAAQALILRQTYVVEAKMMTARRVFGGTQLGWREISKVERSRHASGGIIRALVSVCRVILAIAARSETGIRSFPWSPRVPEYLTLRGAGRQVSVRLHRLARPDELLAWIEFYEHVGRRPAASQTRPRQAAETVRLEPDVGQRVAAATVPLTDLSEASGPHDPWALASSATMPASALGENGADAAASYAGADEIYDEDEDYEEEDEEEEVEVIPPDEQDEDAWLRSPVRRTAHPAPRISVTPTEPTMPVASVAPMSSTPPPLSNPLPPIVPPPPLEEPFSPATPGGAPSWNFPDEPAAVGSAGFGDAAAPPRSPQPQTPIPAPQAPSGARQTKAPFTAISREELLAEMGQFAPPPIAGSTPPQGAPARMPTPAPPPARIPPGQVDALSDAPTAALEAVPTANPAPSQGDMEDASQSEGEPVEEFIEPERPWLQSGWNPPVLPRFGPGGYKPPDDDER
ncbi:MAG TPA: hypothetical protein VKQ36_05380 [Ktedonobacterales bacterium]|nr:hypothetical protein [Ktedonobacterales bacterium]